MSSTFEKYFLRGKHSKIESIGLFSKKLTFSVSSATKSYFPLFARFFYKMCFLSAGLLPLIITETALEAVLFVFTSILSWNHLLAFSVPFLYLIRSQGRGSEGNRGKPREILTWKTPHPTFLERQKENRRFRRNQFQSPSSRLVYSLSSSSSAKSSSSMNFAMKRGFISFV